jgi:hypothetical protein
MASAQSLWFRIGYALERAKHPTPSAGNMLKGLAERASTKKPRRLEDGEGAAGISSDDLVTAGLVLAAGKLLDLWRPRRRARLSTLLRSAVAGAGAALLLDLLRPLLEGRPPVGGLDPETGERVLAGAGQGLLYGAVVEPRLPGPPLLKGALFGSAEYVADPAGGLSHVVGTHAPHRRLPLVGDLFGKLEPHERTYLEHLTFGIALALLYGSSPSSNGILPEDEGD